jgi:endonuclease/exonuclease/phosphatase family metal-dependent hydrolase
MRIPPPRPGHTRLCSYNILEGGGGRLESIIRIVKDINPAASFIQEAKHWDLDGSRRYRRFAESIGHVAAPLALSNSHDSHLAMTWDPRLLALRGHELNVDQGKFHHTLARADFATVSGGHEFTTLYTHLSFVDGEVRLREANWLTEHGDEKSRVLLIGDLNTGPLYGKQPDWERMPKRLHSRHRLARRSVGKNGEISGKEDRRALRALDAAGFCDPYEELDRAYEPTVGTGARRNRRSAGWCTHSSPAGWQTQSETWAW